MGTKVSVSDLTSDYASKQLLNTNFDTLADAFDNTLSRDGTSPNEMEANLDMNSNRILNLPAPVADQEPLRKVDGQSILDEAQADADAAAASAAASAASAAAASGSASSASASASDADASATSAANSASSAATSAATAAADATAAAAPAVAAAEAAEASAAAAEASAAAAEASAAASASDAATSASDATAAAAAASANTYDVDHVVAAQAIAGGIPIAKAYVKTAGYRAVGDGGKALWARSASIPAHGCYWDDAAGAHFVLAEPVADAMMVGGYGDGVHSDSPAFAKLNAYVTSGSKVTARRPSVKWLLTSTATFNVSGTQIEIDGTVDATGFTGSAIKIDAANIKLRAVDILGPAKAVGSVGVEGGSNASNIVIDGVRPTGFECGISTDTIGVDITQTVITTGNTHGMKYQRHSVFSKGVSIGNDTHNIWLCGDGSRGYVNLCHLGTKVDYPAGGAAIYVTGQANYNFVDPHDCEGGAGVATQKYLDKSAATQAIAWTIRPGLVAGTASPQTAGIDSTDMVFGGRCANAAFMAATDQGTIIIQDAGGNGGVNCQMQNPSLAETQQNMSANTNSFTPTSPYQRLNPSAAVTIGGMTHTWAGNMVTLHNTRSNTVTLVDKSTSGGAAGRLFNLRGSNVVLNNGYVITLMYSITDAEWVVKSKNF